MPGVVVSTGVRTGPQSVVPSPASTYFLVGTAPRGPVIWHGSATTTAPQLITSMAEFVTYFGSYDSSSSLWQNAKIFFEEGGTKAYIGRVTGASAAPGTLNLNISAGASTGITLTAANPGTWSSGLTATVETVGSSFVLRVFLSGTQVYSTGTVATINDAVNKITATGSAAKPYFTATAVNGTTTLAATAAASAFSAGAAPTSPTTTDYTGSLARFDQGYGAGCVAIPGQTGATIWGPLIAHARAFNRIALLADTSAQSVATTVTNAATCSASTGAESAAMYHPHVTMTNDAGVTLTVSPESFVAAKRALAHQNVGAWQPAAGVLSQGNFITGLSLNFTKSEGDTLDIGRVNAIRTIQGYPRVYGARSLSLDEDNYRYLTQREVLNYIVTEAEKRLEDLVFSPLDARRTIYGLIEARMTAMLDPIRAKGGLFEYYGVNGELIDPGYSVVCDDSINPVAQLASGIVKARVGVRISSVGDQIQVDILKTNLTSTVV